jgi:hypothetical protein
MIPLTSELSDVHKNYLKEEIMEQIIEKLMEKLHVMVKEKVQSELKKYQYTTNNKFVKIQKQLNELREDFNTTLKQRKL